TGAGFDQPPREQATSPDSSPAIALAHLPRLLAQVESVFRFRRSQQAISLREKCVSTHRDRALFNVPGKIVERLLHGPAAFDSIEADALGRLEVAHFVIRFRGIATDGKRR